MLLMDVVQKLEFLKAAARTNGIPQLPETLTEIINDIEGLNTEQKFTFEIKEVVKPIWFLKVLVCIEVEVTWFPNKSMRFKVLKVVVK